MEKENSGNLGARNAGRTLGKLAFCITLLLDALKGAISVYIGRLLEFDDLMISLGVLICILGHLFPFWLRLKGGKGVATMIGGLLNLNPYLIFIIFCGIVFTLPFTKSLTASMIFGFLVCSISIFLFHLPLYFPIIISFLFITWKHRENLMRRGI